jgi:HK97 family phage prohead protease
LLTGRAFAGAEQIKSEKRQEGYMVVRCGNGDLSVRSRCDLLDFLRGVSNRGGVVNDDVSLFVPVMLQIKNEGQDEGVPWVFSTFDLDRFEERIDPAGWELEHYKKNPVVQWAHRFDIPASGRAAGLLACDDGLHGSVIFNGREYDAFGWGIGERVKAGVLRAGSVGFRVIEIELPDKEQQADGTSLIFRRQELLEFSICNVPANPFALNKLKMTSEELKMEKAPDFGGGIIQDKS